MPALFVLWVRAAQQDEEATRRRVVTTLLGPLVAVLLMIQAGALLSWPPPVYHPSLAGLHPPYIYTHPGPNSFPSQSTTLYAAVAAGVFSLHKATGTLLWVGVVLLGGLPRIYVGGHYPSDVLAGIVLGLAGYGAARHWLEPRLVRQVEGIFKGKTCLRVLGQLAVFAWILQVATEFRDVVWRKSALQYLLK